MNLSNDKSNFIGSICEIPIKYPINIDTEDPLPLPGERSSKEISGSDNPISIMIS